MARKASVPGERKVWVAYLLWPTLVGHRWYLAKLSPVYTLTLGYFGIMWLADLFRIPAMVREYNSFVYQRSMARAMYGNPGGTEGSPTARWSSVFVGGMSRPPFAESASTLSARDGAVEEPTASSDTEKVPTSPEGPANLPQLPGGAAAPLTKIKERWFKTSPRVRMIAIATAGLVVVIILLASIFGSGNKGKEGEEGTQAPAAVKEVAEKLTITLTTPSGLTFNSPNATLEGVTEPGASVVVLGCANAPLHLQAREDGRFTAALTLNEGTNFLTVTAEKEGRKGSTSCSLTYQLDEATYKAQCRPIEFRMLEKNPDAYKGQKYFATGQVVQIMEGLGTTDIRMNVTRDQWGLWDDTIYVTYAGTVPAYEESIIRVWGEIKGSYTYTSVAGWTITLPWVEAKYIEVVQP